jgi:hypothetical protein
MSWEAMVASEKDLRDLRVEMMDLGGCIVKSNGD